VLMTSLSLSPRREEKKSAPHFFLLQPGTIFFKPLKSTLIDTLIDTLVHHCGVEGGERQAAPPSFK
jgi:hypothetical protein